MGSVPASEHFASSGRRRKTRREECVGCGKTRTFPFDSEPVVYRCPDCTTVECKICGEKKSAREAGGTSGVCKDCRNVECDVCGVSFVATPSRVLRGEWLTCGQECKRQLTGQDVSCKGCGKVFWKSNKRIERTVNGEHFCTYECNVKHRGGRVSLVCCRCGVTFTRTVSEHEKEAGNKPYCGVACYREEAAEGKKAREAEEAARKAERAKARAEAARARAEAAEVAKSLKAASRILGRMVIEFVECEACGGAFDRLSYKQTRFCDDCREARGEEARRAAKRKRRKRDGKDHHKSRCRRKGLPYSSGLNLRALLKRDAHRCFWCNVRTADKYEHIVTLFGRTVNPKSPTIDHVVPLNHPANTTHGHTKDNTVLCCAECNSLKSDIIVMGGVIESDNPREYVEKNRKGWQPPWLVTEIVSEPPT